MPFQPFLALAAGAESHPADLFYADNSQTVTFSEARDVAVQFAGQLRLSGVKAGDTVAIDLPNGMQVLFAFAVAHLAAVSATVSVQNSPTGITWDWWLTSQNGQSRPAHNVVIIDNEFLVRAAGLTTALEATPYAADDAVCRIALTSGTTGRSKGISLSVAMVEHRTSEAARLFTAGKPFLCTLGLGTTSGFHTLIAGVRAGLPYLSPSNGPGNRDAIRRHGVAAIKASPQQISDIVTASTGEYLDSLHTAYSAGGKFSQSLADGLRSVSGATIVNLYGSSEAGRAAEHTLESVVNPEHAGRIVAGTTLDVVDDRGNPIPRGTTGVIRYRTPLMAVAYLGDEVATAETFREGWFYPGDIGRLDADGSLYLTGRVSDTLNAGGTKIDPTEFEDFAATLPGITEALGFTHTNDLGVPQFVLAIAGNSPDVAAVSVAIEGRFGRSRPSGIFSVPAIPRTETGKASRHLTAELYAEALARANP